MPQITPHLWFDTQAKEAAELYVATFGGDSKIDTVTTLHDTPSGDSGVVSFQLAGQPFMAISAGPVFKFNPAISFFICCETTAEVDTFWEKLSPGGSVLMELGKYPFSEHYGWLADKYGVSWQIMFMGGQPIKQKIIPALMFTQQQAGKAEEAMKLYTSIFPNSEINYTMRYETGEEPDTAGSIKHAGFVLDGQQFTAMDSAHDHKFIFNEAISLVVPCETQEEIDYYWSKLSADPKAEQCGWLKDQYGVSWQITPTLLGKLLADPDKAKVDRVTQAFLQMKKFDIAALQKAADQE